MITMDIKRKQKIISAHGRRILRRREVCDMLGITRPALNDKINRETIQSYIFVDNYRKLQAVGPHEVGRDQERVFLAEEIEEYIAAHPVVGKTPAYDIDDDDRAAIMKEAQYQIGLLGTVRIQSLKLMMNKRHKRPSASLPVIMQMIDENRWPLFSVEQAEIDDLIAEGRRLNEEHGYVRRRELSKFMHDQYKKGDQYYSVIAYIANREAWPMEENAEKIAAKRRAGRLNRHVARPRGDV
jgi:hypothetical protein